MGKVHFNNSSAACTLQKSLDRILRDIPSVQQQSVLKEISQQEKPEFLSRYRSTSVTADENATFEKVESLLTLLS